MCVSAILQFRTAKSCMTNICKRPVLDRSASEQILLMIFLNLLKVFNVNLICAALCVPMELFLLSMLLELELQVNQLKGSPITDQGDLFQYLRRLP